jgi:hypothetical protein
MPTEFDPIKALQEELAGLVTVAASIKRREMAAEEAMARAEIELNDVRKVSGYLKIEMDRKRIVLRELQEAKDRKKDG